MYKDIFKKKKRLPRGFKATLIVLLGLILIVFFVQLAIILWYRPIVIVRISEFSLSAGAQKIMPGEQIKNVDFPVVAPSTRGTLHIGMQNIGRSLARDISLNFLPRDCILGKLYVKKSDTDCLLEVSPPIQVGPTPDPNLQRPKPQEGGYYRISVKGLRPGSQVPLKYTI